MDQAEWDALVANDRVRIGGQLYLVLEKGTERGGVLAVPVVELNASDPWETPEKRNSTVLEEAQKVVPRPLGR